MNIPFRGDAYGKQYYYEDEAGLHLIPYQVGTVESDGIRITAEEQETDGLLTVRLSFHGVEPKALKRLGFRLGIDCYMDTYPQWNDKFFPTALRCEEKGFWSCFVSPLGKRIAVCSPDPVASWKNEYNFTDHGDVGHRIYTSSVELINTYPQPERHPKSPEVLTDLELTLYYGCPDSMEALWAFVERYAGLKIPQAYKYTLEAGEKLLVDGAEYPGELHPGLNRIAGEGTGELTVFVRKDWLYYLDCARKSAEICQQKPGTHAESWYGYFSRVAYAKIAKDPAYTAALCGEFDKIFAAMTEYIDGVCRMREKTLPHRLQNTSSMLSLLADFHELTGNRKYLDDANDLAAFLMELQEPDGSYRNKGTHYTCVIYPAKSMLELALAEQAAGLTERYQTHYDSAYKAIDNLAVLLDDIQTEGEMTFEDGMISCESLQLGYLATLLPEGAEKKRFAEAAELVLKKHLCLEQHLLPDCRVRGCTTRYWEARYDLNFFANMLNCPHGWTSWKTYATWYLYLLTGKLDYLRDTMDTMGACVQCVNAEGVLHWAYIADPCVVGLNMKTGCQRGAVAFEKQVVGECYLPMISDWYRQDENDLILQYLESSTDDSDWDINYGGSCDNDVHEHFKCLDETVFGKAFAHETESGWETYNCKRSDGGFVSGDPCLKQWVIFARNPGTVMLNGKATKVEPGFQFLSK